MTGLSESELPRMTQKAGEAEAFLKAIANRQRLLILCELSKGERSVTMIGQSLSLSQSALSQHLARLRDDQLVRTRRESQTIYYSLADERVTQTIRFLYEVFCRVQAD